MAFVREVAHRMFAQEFNASRVELKGQGEKEPSFIVTPLGRKVNRLHIVGVCTEVEPVGESGEVYRARISDPTGMFTVYAGQYQPEAAQVLSNLQPPAYVAVTGKARTYEPEPGSFFVSIRPETISVVDEATRDQWVIQAAEHTLERVGAFDEGAEPGRPGIADGVTLAQEHYGMMDPAPHKAAAADALRGLLPGGSLDPPAETKTDAPTWKAPEKEEDAEADAFDDAVMALVQKLEGDKGASWESILAETTSGIEGATDESVEESLNRLMDKGLVYEPTLGVLRST